ncbi:MAG: LuxR C-terminal-related transcriptional regulator [Spirochaetes bacterium]|nr:LuxR C-terminal-related transcriptional regulator [Spirochaetota bacterium]
MDSMNQLSYDSNILFHFERQRLNQLFKEAVKCPLVMVCAGAGYGKTSAVRDFIREYGVTTAWVQLSERDNIPTRFWEHFSHTIAQLNKPFAQAIVKLGFPDTDDKFSQFFSVMHKHVEEKQHILVFDDFHLIENQSVLHLVEYFITKRMDVTSSVFLISRALPQINVTGLMSKGRVFSISENDLCFIEPELAQYFRRQKIPLRSDTLREIMQDTGGWAFAINLIMRSYQKAPGYSGYLRNAMKTNIFKLMESEIWNGISDRLQSFLIRLSLIDHLSVDLISLLSNGDKELIIELERQNSYVRRDSQINAYLIHHLFLEFLCQKQKLLTEEQKRETYIIGADWCNKNGFKVDAMGYYEKVGDYESIVAIFFELPTQVPYDIACYAADIFSRTPEEAFDSVDFLAAMHVRAVVCLGTLDKAVKLMEYYEEKYQKLPIDNVFRNRTLGGIYYCWGFARMLMCTIDHRYDFDLYFAKQDYCLTISPGTDPGQLANHQVGPWVSQAGSSEKGALQEHIDALTRSMHHASHCMKGTMAGIDDLAKGELKFYQGDIRAAEHFVVRSLEFARKHRQFDIAHRALFYMLRLAVAQGDYLKAEQAVKDIETQLDESDYTIRFVTFDIAMGWYYCVLNMLEMVPDWLKEKFTHYGHPYFIENFGNQVKARYCYITKSYPLLLAYMQELKHRESILFGRVEMLAMEACVHYKLKNKTEAFAILTEAYETALPNSIQIPFTELGKGMRTLTASALKDSGCKIPKSWLVEINRKSASYAKYQSHIIAIYKQANRIKDDISFSQRELEILTDICHGLSRTEIAVARSLSVNTVKMVINNIYSKLGAENLADLIRIAVERKLV